MTPTNTCSFCHEPDDGSPTGTIFREEGNRFIHLHCVADAFGEESEAARMAAEEMARIAARMDDAQIALPPPYPKWKFRPMRRREAEAWLERYNAWVDVWNRHETDLALPLSPDWPEAVSVFAPGLPESALVFRPRDGQAGLGVIRLKNWRPYAPGWSFCRMPASAERIVWAGWAP